MRGDEGYLLALAYSTQRGYGRNHPFAGEIRSGYVAGEIVPEELGFAVNIGELLMTECEMVNGFVARGKRTAALYPRLRPDLRHERAQSDGDGAGRPRAAGAGLRREIAGPAQDEEFVLAHADNVEAAGFVSHLKLPHYVDFQAELALLKRLQRENERG
jgi:alpha-D-ribose 1-methylphosphonate 5-triphosphate synthase subunit PhnI